MPIDPNIILGIKPVQIQQPMDPLERASKELTYKSLVQQGQMQQQGMDDDASQRQAVTSSGGDNARYRALLAQSGNYKALQAFDKATSEKAAKDAVVAKDTAAAGKSDFEVAKQKLEHGAALLEGVKDQATYDMAIRVGSITGTFPKQMLDQLPKEYNPQVVESLKQAGLTRAQQLTAQNQAATLDQTRIRDTATNARGVEANRIADNRQTTQAAAAAAGPNLTPDAIDQAAARYAIDGTLPTNLGRGSQGAANTALILNKAAATAAASGDGAESARIRQIAGRASTAALAQITKQEGMVGAFEKNFVRNADLALEQSAKVDRLGSPAIDRWIQAGKKNIAGDASVATLDVAMKAVINEYTKIISGSMGNAAMAESEIKKVTDLLNSASSPSQVREVIAFMKKETQNRMKGFAEQKAEISHSMRGQPQASQPPAASPAAAPSQSVPGPASAPTDNNDLRLKYNLGEYQPPPRGAPVNMSSAGTR